MPDRSMVDIAELLKALRFRRKLLFGIDERDVWLKLDEIQKSFREIYEAREIRYITILEMHGIDHEA